MAKKLAAVAAQGRQRACGHITHREASGVGRVVDVKRACNPVAQQAHAGRPVMLSKLPDTAPVDDAGSASA